MRWFFLVVAAVALGISAQADFQANSKTPVVRPMSRESRLLVVGNLNAEVVYVRRVIPSGIRLIVIKNGQIVSPTEQEFEQMDAASAPLAKAGDRVKITNVEVKHKKIVLDINGGEEKWYQRIQVSGMGWTSPDTDRSTKPHGWKIELAFDRFVPEMTSEQVRQLLFPVIDFTAISALEAYLNTIPSKAKAAIQKHEVLVGMNRDMVLYAKGQPHQRIRDKDKEGRDYEEWLYGRPPQDVEFVRFIGDEVVRVEIMKLDGQKTVRTEKEIDLKPAAAEKSREPRPNPSPVEAPGSKRPSEQPD